MVYLNVGDVLSARKRFSRWQALEKWGSQEMCIYSSCWGTKTNPPWHQFMWGWICIKPKWSRDCSSLFFFFFFPPFCPAPCFAWTKQPWNTMQILTHLKCSIKITLSERLGVFFLFLFFFNTRNTEAWRLCAGGRKSLKHQVGRSVESGTLSCSPVHCLWIELFWFDLIRSPHSRYIHTFFSYIY